MFKAPMEKLAKVLRHNGLVRFVEHFEELYPHSHLKDLVVEEIGEDRIIRVQGRQVINFGSDSFLGLDRDPRVQQALIDGIKRWGTHNGSSRAFSSVEANIQAEQKIARWLGTEAALIYPSVTLANMGAVPGLVGRQDLLVVDEHAHNSIQEAARIAKANGVRLAHFSHCDPTDLKRVLSDSRPYRVALVAIDGVYSMSGALPPLADLNSVAKEHDAVLYVDDAHATAVIGAQGRGTVLDALGSYDNAFAVGSLSKGFSCLGAFIGCSNEFKKILKVRSNTYIFGGPVAPPYLEAICAVCDILMSGEYDLIIERLRANCRRLVSGLAEMGLVVLGGDTPIISVLVGDEEDTLSAGNFLFERGFYVQSVTFPAVPYHGGVLRVQVNANHRRASIDALIDACQALRKVISLPTSDQNLSRAA